MAKLTPAREINLITARKRSLGQGNVFTPVCQFTRGENWLPSMHHRSEADIPPPDRHPSGGRHPPGRHPLDRHPPADRLTTEAGGTHPTGMHSCFPNISKAL